MSKYHRVIIYIVTDMEDNYNVSQHIILADTPDMEKLMDEYLDYMQDPVPCKDGQCITC